MLGCIAIHCVLQYNERPIALYSAVKDYVSGKCAGKLMDCINDKKEKVNMNKEAWN